MHLHCFFIFSFHLFLSFFSPHLHSSEFIPVSHGGRIRPAEAYARLWLSDLYHSQSLKSSHWSDFHSHTGSALDFLWQLHVHGYKAFEAAPLFRIHSKELKKLLSFDPLQTHFSYKEVYKAFYEHTETSLSILQRLIVHHFFKTYLAPFNHSQAKKLELANLMPGLWVQLHSSYLTVISLPLNCPWTYLKVGQAFNWQQHDMKSFEALIHIDKKLVEEAETLRRALDQFEKQKGAYLESEVVFEKAFEQLRSQPFPSKEVERILEQRYPLKQRLREAGSLWKVLPGRWGEWFSLHALKVRIYHPQEHQLLPITNFTLFSDDHFEHIRNAYLEWEQSLLKPEAAALQAKLQEYLFLRLRQAYETIQGQAYQQAQGKALFYPSIRQLKLEAFYHSYPLFSLVIGLYSVSLIGLIISQQVKLPILHYSTSALLILAFSCHTFLLFLRGYILGRPPVSNMFETVIYVPWVTVLVSFAIKSWIRHPLILITSCSASIILFLILRLTDMNSSLENVQAVLDSQFWLTVHVLMIVGSYGLFILSGVISHFYLAMYAYHKMETAAMRLLTSSILQTMYIGIALLIPGTILGGIWAAESWGRFWDWDPKESWAFISSCIYLVWIHAYRFHKISNFGLACGSIIGLLSISFTWYGVNYILGTGLHSYGFGSGGELYYYAFLLGEIFFIIYTTFLFNKLKSNNLKINKTQLNNKLFT